MIYASKRVAGDPKPWRYVLLDPNGQAREATQVTGGFIYDPRPEYAPKHEANPILVDVRIYRAGRHQMNNPKGWDHVLRKFEQAVATTYPWSDATIEHVTHARKVLTRLAHLEEQQ